MPTTLYYTATESKGIPYLGNQVNYYIENSTALESMYRINVGGSLVSPEGDTGMYRTWNEDDPYLDVVSRRSSIIPLTSYVELRFSKIPEYTAPKEVYHTGRSTKDRVFLIYIANQTAEKHADIILWSGGNGVPVYKDYIVYMLPKQSKLISFLHCKADQVIGKTRYNNAILNGLEIFKLNDTNGNLAGPNPDPPDVTTLESGSQNSKNSNKKKLTAMFAIVVGVVVSGILVLCILGFLVFKRGRKVKDSRSSRSNKVGSVFLAMTKSTKSRGSSLPSRLCQYFSLAEIKAATENFNETFIIGVGGFGNVYKGCIDGGANLVAVAIKRLKATSSQGAREFVTEIEMLCRLRHRHLVSLIGYCADEGEMILVYDYMARGTLRDHLYQTKNPHLSWEQRLHICIGAAQGLHYLHTGTKGTIIHRDVKSANILLGREMDSQGLGFWVVENEPHHHV
ncbi:hypothetical protein M0R45_033238 [Rubus argutus]|uniref:Protein kinase domain-containing protein n=1 Tax=Rubus argutus TaxID=59490 RepID=A0AAW1WJZ3_RUBAR